MGSEWYFLEKREEDDGILHVSWIKEENERSYVCITIHPLLTSPPSLPPPKEKKMHKTPQSPISIGMPFFLDYIIA